MTLTELLLRGARLGAARTAQITDARAVSYGELAEQTGAVARGLRRLGLEPGDRVALLVPTVPEYVPAYHGIVAAGGVVVPVNPRARAAEIYQHPAVAEAAVVAAPDALKGEAVCACVALRPGTRATEGELITFCKARLTPYKAPARVEFLPALPKGPTGKLLRRELRALVAPASRPRLAPGARANDLR